MKFYKFALLKAYFDKGYGVTSYFKYLFAIIGIAGLKGSILIPLFIAYGLSCFFVGWVWYHFRITDAEAEVGNQYNPFAKEVRQKLKVKNS